MTFLTVIFVTYLSYRYDESLNLINMDIMTSKQVLVNVVAIR